MFTIKIADLLVEIDNRYDEIEKRCKDYIVEPDREPDIKIATTDGLMSETLAVCSKEDFEQYSMGDLEYFALHESIYPHLPQFSAAWMHACVVDVDGESWSVSKACDYVMDSTTKTGA